MYPIRYAISGAAGRMGRRIVALAADDTSLTCTAALESAGHADLGRDIGILAGIRPTGLAVCHATTAAFDVFIDFSTPRGTVEALDVCRRENRPILIGTTGHAEAQLALITDASKEISILKSPNMSIGIALLFRAVRDLSRRLGPDFDVEIVEAHHRHKTDAPSGTALALVQAVQEGRRSVEQAAGELLHGRAGRDLSRPRGEIGVHALRMGETAGEHTVYFSGPGETLLLSHIAHSRDTFAAGALRAAKWLVGRPPGLYDMQDVLFGDGSA